MLEHRVPAVLGRLDDARVAAGPERDRVRPRDAGGCSSRDGAGDGSRILVVVVADLDGACGVLSLIPTMPAASYPWNTAASSAIAAWRAASITTWRS